MTRTPIRSRKQRADTPSTSSGAHLILICIGAFAVRVAVALPIGKLPLNRTPQYDALEYLMWARRIAAGDFTWPVNPPHGPAYPFFLGLTLFAGGGALMFARIVQAALGAATCYFAGATSQRIFNHRGGLITAGLLAIYSPLIWLDVSIASEGLLMFLLAAAMWAFVTKRSQVLVGALMGAAILTRPTAAIFLLLFPRRKILATAIALVIPVTIANWRTSHAFLPVQAFGGMNIYLGNSPARDGKASARPGGSWEQIEPQAARNGARTIAEEDRYFMRLTMSEIASRPIGYGALLLRKLFWTLHDDEIRDTHSFYFFTGSNVLLRWLPGFGILLMLAAGAAVSANWKDANVRLIGAFIAIAIVTCVLLVVGARYRIPLALGLALECGSLLPPSRDKRALVAAAIAALLAFTTRDASTRNLSEEWALTGTSMLKEDDLNGAENAARKAIETDAANALGWDALGTIHASAGRGKEAETEFRRAVAINPYYTGAHEHLGLLLAQQGDVPAAAAEYRTAVALDPRRFKALMGLARLEGALGRAAEGLAAAQKAAVLQPLDDDGWLLMAMLAADVRKFDVAESALTHVSDVARAEEVRARIRR